MTGASAAPTSLVGGPIYLDYNATTPTDPRVVEAMLPYLSTHFGNPSSIHAYAHRPREAVATARARVAHLIGAEPDEIVFTGTGSEADWLAIRGVVLARRDRGDHLITQRTEHPAVLKACRALERFHGFAVTELDVDATGLVDPAALEAAITARTILVTIMHANSETGTVQPIRRLAEIAHSRQVAFHTDAAQSVGKIPARVDRLGVDLMTLVGHKIYAPKGIGALYVRRGMQLEPVSYGGGQEKGLRAGTESVAHIVGLGEACRLLDESGDTIATQMRGLRDLLHQRLDELLPGRVHLNGHPTDRLPNTLNVSIDGIEGDRLLAAAPQLAASTGSACHAGSTDPSAVLLAMGHGPQRAQAALRLTLGRWSTQAEVATAAEAIASAVAESEPSAST
jgi:cysteine desulfurase